MTLKVARSTVEKLSWKKTAEEMAASGEDWSKWDAASNDGLDEVPWQVRKGAVAERGAR